MRENTETVCMCMCVCVCEFNEQDIKLLSSSVGNKTAAANSASMPWFPLVPLLTSCDVRQCGQHASADYQDSIGNCFPDSITTGQSRPVVTLVIGNSF